VPAYLAGNAIPDAFDPAGQIQTPDTRQRFGGIEDAKDPCRRVTLIQVELQEPLGFARIAQDCLDHTRGAILNHGSTGITPICFVVR
jgi:hypothetical protein